MPEPEMVWTALPRSIDTGRRTLVISVVVAPKLAPGMMPTDLMTWPHFVRDHQNDFRFEFNGGPPIAGRLQWTVDPADSDALWCRFFEGQPVREIKTTANDVPITSNSAGKVAALMKSAKADLFTTVSEKLVAHLDAPTLDSFRAVAVAENEIPEKFQSLAFWRGSDSGRQHGATAADGDAIASFDRWLHEIQPPELRAVVERNLFRLADRPYEDLTVEALETFQRATIEMYDIDTPFIVRNVLPRAMTSSAAQFSAASNASQGQPQHVLQMLAFHRRVRNEMRDRTSQLSALTLPADPFEFHERVALLNGRPAILRAVGLILDFEIEYAGMENELRTTQGTIRTIPPVVMANGAPMGLQTPRTRYLFDDAGRGRFEAAGGVIHKDGFLRIGNGEYALESIDADGAAFKAVHSVSGGVTSQAGVQYGERTPADDAPAAAAYAIPADRTSGISLVHRRRAQRLRALLRNITTASSNPVLEADDVTSGYIVEIRSDIPGRNEFASQMQRLEKHLYAAAGEPDTCLRLFDAGEQEGALRLAATRAHDRSSNSAPVPRDLHVGETVVRWDGWSLAAPRFFGGDPVPPEQPPDDERELPWTLKSVYRAKPGSLTPLRFGHQYWFRLRGVDVAGNPMTATEPADPSDVILGGDEDGFLYRRYEPVPHPVVLLTSPIDRVQRPGESLRRLVLTKPVRKLADQASQRCIIPPASTFRTAEQHGMFDDGSVHPERNSGFDDIGLIAQCDACGNPGWRFEETEDGDPLCVPPERASGRGAYWPDPMADSVCVRIEDLVTGEYLELDPQPFYRSGRKWPKAERIMLRLQHGADGSARIRTQWMTPTTLAIALPPSWVARVFLSSGIPTDRAGDMAHFAAWRQMLMQSIPAQDGGCSPAAARKIEAIHHAVTCGCHPMISPCEELILVHPVKKPLRAPVIDEIRVLQRPAGDVSAAFEIDMHFDRKSTGRLDLNAAWKEMEDLKSLPAPQASDAAAHVIDWPVDTPEKARDFDPLALSAFPQVAPVIHRFPDTKHREITYTLRGTSRFKQEFPAPEVDDPKRFVDDSSPYVVSIPSSAPPKKPDVLYVMPTFDWTNEVAPTLEPGARIYSRRAGGGLRIFMDRGWFSSGAGERLAVVLWPSITSAQCERLNEGKSVSFGAAREFPLDAERLAKYVTRWGLDPIWHRKAMPFLPTPHHFHAPKGQQIVYGCKLRLQECADISNCDRASTEVGVVSYEPRYDRDLQRWYCDIQIHPVPSYNTFIRLALARYQPDSIPGAELSPVVLADFAQLLPDRAVSVTRVPLEHRKVALQVFGPSNVGNEFEVTVERACGDIGGDMAWMHDPCIIPEPVPGSADALLSVQIAFPPGCGPRRIVVRETETHMADADPVERKPEDDPRPVKRVVYADVIEI